MPSGSFTATVGQLVLGPQRDEVDGIHGRTARLVTLWALVAALVTLGGAASAMHAPDPAMRSSFPPILLSASAAFVGTFFALRRGHGRLGVRVFVLVNCAIPALMLALLPRDPIRDGMTLVFFAVSALIVSTLLPMWASAVFAAAAVAAGVVLRATSTLPRGEVLEHATVFLGTFLAMLLVITRHRSLVAADRERALRERNAELEELRARLERRVRERTAELEATTGELEQANRAMLENQRRMVLTEKMASLGRITAGIAHEISSPLAAIRAAVTSAQELIQEYQRSAGDPDVSAEDHRAIAAELREAMELADAGSQRAAGFVKSIKAQTRDPHLGERARIDWASAIRETITLLGATARAARCEITFQEPSEPVLREGTPGRVEQVVTNLLQNAIDASGEDRPGRIAVTLRDEGDQLLLRVSDDGPGIPAEILPRIFDPLFTTKPIGKGTGLGLTIVHDVVHGELGGQIEVESAPGRGTTFVIRVPRHAGGTASHAA
jgi:signal transduction histidine kinase